MQFDKILESRDSNSSINERTMSFFVDSYEESSFHNNNQDGEKVMARKISNLSNALSGAESSFGGHVAQALTSSNCRTLDFEVNPSDVATGQTTLNSTAMKERCQNGGGNDYEILIPVQEKKDKLQPLTPFEIALERAQNNKSVQQTSRQSSINKRPHLNLIKNDQQPNLKSSSKKLIKEQRLVSDVTKAMVNRKAINVSNTGSST